MDSLGKELVIVTVATHATDGFHRFNRSINLYGLKLEVNKLLLASELNGIFYRFLAWMKNGKAATLLENLAVDKRLISLGNI